MGVFGENMTSENQVIGSFCTSIDEKYGCKEIKRLDSVIIKDLGGFIICGKRGE